MNENDEHLIYEQLALFGGYKPYVNDSGFVTVVDETMMEPCLEHHPNWSNIRSQPPLLVYDRPSFISPGELMDVFCPLAVNQGQQDQICSALNLEESSLLSNKKRQYRLFIYSTLDPTTPIAFSSFDLELSEDVDQIERQADVKLINLRCDFAYAFVISHYRNMGVGAVLGMMMGHMFWQQIHHLWLQIDGSESALLPLIYSDNFSRGGQEIIKTVLRELAQYSRLHPADEKLNYLRAPKIIS